ncbi:hypothetical protein BGZ83_001510 [Gryganskiella cystojenkinii]|nr:hypothetical protein BGZ83_001510 [Gryganskiella cystojenkinii]
MPSSSLSPSSQLESEFDTLGDSAATSKAGSCPALLILTLDRVSKQRISDPTLIEDMQSPGHQRSSHYRTLYIYSPKFGMDVRVQQLQKARWPQIVVLNEVDVSENEHQNYNFQIWLSGSSARQMDINHDDDLRGVASGNVVLLQDVDSREWKEGCKWTSITTRSSGDEKKGGETGRFSGDSSAAQHPKKRLDSCSPEILFLAHKCILEANPFFQRMLNGGFQEGQVSKCGMYQIELGSDLFDASIMDPLLDYLYTRGPVSSDGATKLSSVRPLLSPATLQVNQQPRRLSSSRSHHVVSANVQLNMQRVVSETIKTEPPKRDFESTQSAAAPSRPIRQNCRSLPGLNSFSDLTLENWCALYRASVPLEDKGLQSLSLEHIEDLLDPDTTLEQVLRWGHQHEDVRAVMVDYLVKKRRDVFGDEQRNQMRPYLWSEYDHQVDTLVHITSQIANQ